MSAISVAEAAKRLGVHVQRIHQRIADGSLPAERIGRQWVIDESAVARLDRNSPGRPLSARSAWILAALASGDQKIVSAVAPSDRSRGNARLRHILEKASKANGRSPSEDQVAEVAASLRFLLRGRADRRVYRASPRDLPDLRADDRLSLAGLSLPTSGISSGDLVEAYIESEHLRPLSNDYLLSDTSHGRANVILHVVKRPANLPISSLDPSQNWLLLAVDLAEHQGPREEARAVKVLADAANAPKAPGR